MSVAELKIPTQGDIVEHLHRELLNGLSRAGGGRIKETIDLQPTETRAVLGKHLKQHGVEGAVEFVSDAIAYGSAYSGEARPPVEQLHQALTVIRERGISRDTGDFVEQVAADSQAFQYKTISPGIDGQREVSDHLVAPDEARNEYAHVMRGDLSSVDQQFAMDIQQKYIDAVLLAGPWIGGSVATW